MIFAVYGALLGTQDGRHVVISNSYELVFESAQKVIIDISYLEKRLDCGMIFFGDDAISRACV